MYVYEHPHPAVTADVAVFAIRDGVLQVLLVKRANDPYQGAWALPGGFVKIDEDLESAARRELREETGLEGISLEQLHTFGAPDRDPRERVITVAHYAVIPWGQLAPRAASDAADARWFAYDELPALAFDHGAVLAMARERLKAELERSKVAFRFLPDEFTLAELEAVYEAVLGTRLDKDRFRERVRSLGALEETGRARDGGTSGEARLYRVSAHGLPSGGLSADEVSGGQAGRT